MEFVVQCCWSVGVFKRHVRVMFSHPIGLKAILLSGPQNMTSLVLEKNSVQEVTACQEIWHEAWTTIFIPVTQFLHSRFLKRCHAHTPIHGPIPLNLWDIFHCLIVWVVSKYGILPLHYVMHMFAGDQRSRTPNLNVAITNACATVL